MMRRFLSDKRLIVLLVSVIALVAILAYSFKGRHEANIPEQIVKDVVGFGQTLFSKPAHFITESLENVDGLINTYEENKRLKKHLDAYAADQAKIAVLEEENQSLREVIDASKSLKEFEPIHATVISRNPDQWEEKIVIDQGETHGVERNMAVITPQGLIGKVVLVTPFTATVELLSTENQNFRVSAVVAEKGIYGLIEGYDRKKRQLVMKRIDADEKVEKGQLVMSSGLGGIFPKGLPIGEITEVTTEDYGLTKVAYIEPTADFALLDHVIVAKRLSGVVDGSDGNNTAFNVVEDGKEE